MFLISNTQINPGESGINQPRVKLFVVIGVLCLIWGLTQFHEMQPKLDVDIVPNNIFNVVSDKSLAVGEVIDGAQVREKNTGLPLSGTFVVEKTRKNNVYKILRQTPILKYERTEQPSVDDILDRGPAVPSLYLYLVQFVLVSLYSEHQQRISGLNYNCLHTSWHLQPC